MLATHQRPDPMLNHFEAKYLHEYILRGVVYRHPRQVNVSNGPAVQPSVVFEGTSFGGITIDIC